MTPRPDRYRVTLTLDGRPAMHGYWKKRATAEGKLESWLRTYGSPTSRGELLDTETGETLQSWP